VSLSSLPAKPNLNCLVAFVAANARIGEAKAEFFPQISLTGVFSTASVSLSDFFTGPSRMWSAGPTVTLPLFTAGRPSSNLHATEARARQSLIQYRQSIQQAFKEVDDALVFHQKARQIRLQRERQVEAAQQALALANLRYTNGVSSYLDVGRHEMLRELNRWEIVTNLLVWISGILDRASL
jgi:outer membrane protein, multidrug efflux system